MAQQWTGEQEQVIFHTGGDLTVSAAAGSGKTSVMVERVLRLVREERIGLEKLLLVTFTRAAAGEMRQRIAAALDAALSEHPEDRFLRRQRQALPDAPIDTLHGFCGDLLKNYGAALGLDPDYTLADDARRAVLWNAAKEEALERAFASGSEGFRLLARGWSLYTDDGLSRLCDAVQRAYSASPRGVKWVRDAAEDYERNAEDPFRSRWMDVLMAEERDAVEDALIKLRQAMSLLGLSGAPESYRKAIESDLAQAESLAAETDPERLIRRFPELSFIRLANAGKNADPYLVNEIKSLRADARKDLETIQEKWKPFARRDPAADAARMIPAMYALADLMEDCEAEYRARKDARNCLDFSDLEHRALELLQDEGVRREVSDRFACIFVDEYQDTNAVQEAILMKIAKPGGFFCVGDAKQAIYRFRLADPALFLERYDRSSPDPLAPERRIDLSKNFRSHPGILRFVNAVFSRTMTRELGGLPYDGAAALVPGLPEYPEPDRCAVRIGILPKKERSGEEELDDMADVEREALLAARHIRERVGLPIWDGKRYRPAQYRDFAILMDRTAHQAEPAAQVLRSCGIPCVARNDASWMEQPETLLILSALRWLDNGDRAEELMTLLHSPFGGFSLEELLKIRRAHPETGFPEAARQAAEEGDGLGQRLSSFFTEWDALRERAPYMEVESLIWEIANRRAWYLLLGSRPQGAEAQRHVRMLAEQARSLSRSRERSLFAFLRFAETLADNAPDESSSAGVGEEDAVWITTVHQSKGLEFPVVILLRAGRGFRKDDGRDGLAFHDRLGLGPRAILEEAHWKTTTLAREAVLTLNARESRSEKLRLLYVALTRAREELIVIGTLGSDPAKSLSQWRREKTPRDRAGATSFLEWIAPVIVHHPAFAKTADADEEPADYALEVDWLPEVSRPVRPPVTEAAGDPSEAAAYAEGFAWRYPFASSVDLPSKVAVTALLEGWSTRRREEADDLFEESASGYDPRRAGTVTHSALQYLRAGMDEGAVREELERLRERGVFSREDLALIRVPWLVRFCASGLARRAEASPRVLREQAFNLFVPAGDVYPGLGDCPDPLMVQGVIDLAFEEDGAWVLVDYKTNRIPPEGPRALLGHYLPQLKLYARALEELTDLPVKAAGLALLSSGETVWMEDET